ncbi:MAG: ABC transporter substrate-binding protein [Balneolia bacterium]|nr:ABC transporter substrate-binding protein [Balneolia bacterium]
MRLSAYITLFISFLLLLGACSSTEVVEVRERARSIDPTADAVLPQDEPLRIRFGETEKLRSFDPLFIHNSSSKRVAQFIYEGLTRLDENGNAAPAIASSWEVSSDSLTYTFTLRRDAFFHDTAAFSSGRGRPANAEDVVFVFNRMAAFEVPDHAGRLFADHIRGFEAFMVQERNSYYEQDLVFEEITGIEAVDERTVRFTLNAPYSGFAELLASPYASVYPREAFEGSRSRTGLHSSPVGTGPFSFSNTSADTLVTLERNFSHYDQNLVAERVTSLEFRYFRSESSLFTALSTGEIDIIPQIGPQTAKIVLNEDLDGLSPGYIEDYRHIPTGTEHAAVSLVTTNFDRISEDRMRPVLMSLSGDEYINKLPHSVQFIMDTEEAEQTEEFTPEAFTLRIGAPDDAYVTYLAGLHANILDAYDPSIFLSNFSNRDLHLFWSNSFSETDSRKHQQIADVRISNFALYRSTLSGLIGNGHPWWISLSGLNISDERPS